MKILFLTDLYPINKEEIHTPRTLFDFIEEWQKKDISIKIIKPNFIFNSFIRQKPFYKTGFYGNIFNVNYFTPFWFDVKNKLPKDLDYDVIVAHMPSGLILSNKLNGIKICAVHNSDLEILTNPLYSIYFKSEIIKAYKNAKKIACRSFSLQKKFCNILPEFSEKTFIANSGIKKSQIIERKINLDEKINVITCANLIKRKNIDKLILATKDLTDFNLTIIGSGKEFKNLKKLSPNATFLGQQNQDEVYAQMQKSDIFILPSVNETFGKVYLEAMASGCITIGVKNEGIDGIIQNGKNGFLINPTVEDIKSTLLKIKNMSKDEIYQLNEATYNTIKSYTIEFCADEYLKNIATAL